MPLLVPILDDRSFEQLRDDLVRRIPTYTPEWTNHNETDPGIALLELFAFLGESLLFRFNQLPETTKLAFLRLLHLPPRPARPARAVIVADTDDPTGVQVLRGTEVKAGSVAFETEDELVAWPFEVLAMGKVAVASGHEDARADISRRLGVTGDAVRLYEPTTLARDPTEPGAEPLDVSATIDESLWVALLAKQDAVLDELRGRAIFVGVAMDGSLTAPGDPPFDLASLDAKASDRLRCRGLDTAGPSVLWRLWDPSGPGAPGPPFLALEVIRDTTRGLTESGVVGLTLPRALPRLDPAQPPTGGVDSPPPIDDAEQAARVVAWVQATRPATENDAIHRVAWVGLNAATVLQARTAATELLGRGTGDADQRLRLTNRGILARTAVIEVEEQAGWRAWEEVDGFVASRPDDRHFVVDAAEGEILFGRHCRRPQLGERVRARTYRYGGGLAGRVGAGAITKVTGVAGLKVTNPLPAWGGADPEALNDALDRIPAELHRRDRAVTSEDFQALALEVVGVARAEALPLLHPDVPEERAAGVVSVMVFPSEDRRDPAAPKPDRDLLRQVCEHLDQRRLVTTELYVVPPTYRPLAVAAGVNVKEGYQVDAVRRWVELILRQYLAPVPPYGPEGEGWPLGRDVRRQELEAVAVQVEGVAYLEDLVLAERLDDDSWQPATSVELKRWEVPELVEITVVEGQPLGAGDTYEPSSVPRDDVVFAPLPRDIC